MRNGRRIRYKMQNLIGQSLGRYHIIEQLGQGGMATVYKAFDTRLEREVAVKIIRSELFGSAIFERILKRFEREAKAMARLSHPNIVKVLDYGDHDGSPYLVMELLSGGTLKDLLVSPMPYPQAACLLEPVARGLSYAHNQCILHRDIKPSNILITHEGIPVLTDFGIAKLLDVEEGHTLTGTGVGIGTPEYMAPEQGLGQEANGRADVYSLGVVFYELVTGHKPYSADTPLAVLLKQVNDPLPSPSYYIHDLPESVERVIYKALAKIPEDRYQSMSEFADALNGLRESDAIFTPNPQHIQKPTLPTEVDDLLTTDQMKSEIEGKAVDPSLSKFSSPRITVKNKSLLGKILGFSFLGILSVIFILGMISGWFNPKAALETTATAVNTIPPTSSSTNTGVPSKTSNLSTADIAFGIGSTMVSEKDGMTMVYVPAGEFLMGSPAGVGDSDEHPQHNVYLDAFWIDLTEITEPMYRKCVIAGTCSEPSFPFNGQGIQPITNINWKQAATYCQWAGRLLPTEAQWEKAARGTDGRAYPWGDESPNPELINYQGEYYSRNPQAVGSYPKGASPYGALDMAGNVQEWVSDGYDPNYYSVSPTNNPTGPVNLEFRVLRGGSASDGFFHLRSANRDGINPNYSYLSIGFRCALPIENPNKISITTQTAYQNQTPTTSTMDMTPLPTSTVVTNQIFVTLVNNSNMDFEYHISTEESGIISAKKSITIQLKKNTYYWIGIYKLETTGGPEFQYRIEENSTTIFYRFSFP